MIHLYQAIYGKSSVNSLALTSVVLKELTKHGDFDWQQWDKLRKGKQHGYSCSGKSDDDACIDKRICQVSTTPMIEYCMHDQGLCCFFSFSPSGAW